MRHFARLYDGQNGAFDSLVETISSSLIEVFVSRSK